jgi:hypothetical protein
MADTDYGNAPGDGPLRQGGQSQAATPSSEDNLPSTLSPAAQRQQPALALVRDLSGGTETVRAAGQAYLPRAPGEDGQNYSSRLNRSVFLNAFGHTVEGLTGFVFSKDPVLGEDVPPAIEEHWENIDLTGNHGDVFCRELLQDALTTGHVAILVEYPATGGTQTAADESSKASPFPIRPYWVPIKKDDILSWRSTVLNGHRVLTQVVIRECQYVASGSFGEQEQERYRVLYNMDGVVGWRLLEVTDRKVVLLVGEGLYPTQQEIPLAEVITSGSKGIFDSDPPLLDLAYLNVAHYQDHSDYRHSIHMTNVPFIFGAGFSTTNADGSPADKLIVGPNTSILMPNPDATMQYVAHDGAALGSSKANLDDLKGDMATLGLAMLASEKRVAETAEARRIDKSSSDSALSVTARGLQDGIERALGFHARYMGLEGGSIQINRDFENLTLTPAQIQALSALVRDGHLGIETLWKMLISGNVLPDDFDAAVEKAILDAEEEMRQERQRQMLEAQAASGVNPAAPQQLAA